MYKNITLYTIEVPHRPAAELPQVFKGDRFANTGKRFANGLKRVAKNTWQGCRHPEGCLPSPGKSFANTLKVLRISRVGSSTPTY